MSKLISENNISNPNLIFVGDKLTIDDGQSEQATTSTVSASSTVTSNTTSQSATTVENKTVNTNANTDSSEQAVTTPKQSTSSNSVMTKTSGQLSDSEQSYVANKMQANTGVSASEWLMIMNRESRSNVDAANPSSSARGLFQQLRGGTGSVQEQINNATTLYNQQGMNAWALTN